MSERERTRESACVSVSMSVRARVFVRVITDRESEGKWESERFRRNQIRKMQKAVGFLREREMQL